jgi:hypothetical protein
VWLFRRERGGNKEVEINVNYEKNAQKNEKNHDQR